MVVKTQQLNTPTGKSADCTNSTQQEQRLENNLKVFKPKGTEITEPIF